VREKWSEIVLHAHNSFKVTRGLWSQLEKRCMNLSRAFQGDCYLKVVQFQGDCYLKVVQKADFEKLAQQVIFVHQGKITIAGINASELKPEQLERIRN
jgi:hypothetical protein